jgi:Predicted membrane protein (DUF2232)
MTAPDAESEAPSGAMGRFEIPLAGLLAAACFSAVLLVPLIGALGVPLAAVPMVRLAHRRGFVTGLLGCAMTVAIVFGLGWATGGAAESIALALVAGGVTIIPAAGVGFLRAGADPSRCYLGVCIAGCALLAAAFAAAAGGPGASVSAEVAAAFDRLTPSVMESYSRSGADVETLAGVRAALQGARELARQYLWGIFGALWALGSAVAFYGGAASTRPNATADATRFEELRVPPAAAGLFVACGAGFGLLPGEGRRAAGNLLLPLLALFFVAGLSIICHFFRRWFRARFLRAGLYALASYFPINVGVVLLGLFDWYVDFRRRGEGVRESS